MLNVDGVVLGNNRTGVLGHDFNRNWFTDEFNTNNAKLFPETQSIITLVKNLKKKDNAVNIAFSEIFTCVTINTVFGKNTLCHILIQISHCTFSILPPYCLVAGLNHIDVDANMIKPIWPIAFAPVRILIANTGFITI